MRRMALAAGLAATLVALHAQLPDAAPAFEVASIHPSKPNAEGTTIQGDPNGKLNAENVTLKDLIRFSYRLRDFQVVGGPKWLDADRFDIAAKPESRVSPDQLLPMMQRLLADRFQLAFHRESREARVYELTIAKNGPKLRAPEAGSQRGIQGRKGQITAWSTPMKIFAQYLSQRLGQTVVDKTGLPAEYDFSLEYQLDDGGNAGGVEGASIFTAIQEQLGLRLQPAKGTAEIFVIDRADRPSGN